MLHLYTLLYSIIALGKEDKYKPVVAAFNAALQNGLNIHACDAEGNLPGEIGFDDFLRFRLSVRDSLQDACNDNPLQLLTDFLTSLLKAGFDCRPIWDEAYAPETYTKPPAVELRSLLQPLLEQAVQGVRAPETPESFMGYLKRKTLGSDAMGFQQSVNIVCASGMLPAVVKDCVQQGDSRVMVRISKAMQPFWREQYAHTLQAAEAICARAAAARGGDSALSSWVAGR